MSRFKRSRAIGNLIILIYWVIGINGLAMISTFSIRAFVSFNSIDIVGEQDPFLTYWLSNGVFLDSGLFSGLMAFLYILGERLAGHWRWDRFSFGRLIFVKTATYLIGLLVISFIIGGLFYVTGIYSLGMWNTGFLARMGQVIFAVVTYVVFLLILLNFMVQTSKKVGSGNLISFLTGKYHEPVIEDRIFLFLDLKSSTTYAEKLGSKKYSLMIQDCFDDINYLIEDYRADIYQYVGDEIVLTWPSAQGLEDANCLAIFFAFRNVLEKRAKHYQSAYGFVPVFKAGANIGMVTVAEVGNIRRDIAYHGDVINTAARIQAICNDFNRTLLISGQLHDQINWSNGYQTTSVGDVLLKGKKNRVEVVSVEG